MRSIIHPVRGGRLSLAFECQSYGLKHPIQLPIDVVIAKSKNSVAKTSQSLVTHFIATTMLVEAMLIAINLDDDA